MPQSHVPTRCPRLCFFILIESNTLKFLIPCMRQGRPSSIKPGPIPNGTNIHAKMALSRVTIDLFLSEDYKTHEGLISAYSILVQQTNMDLKVLL